MDILWTALGSSFVTWWITYLYCSDKANRQWVLLHQKLTRAEFELKEDRRR